MDRGPPAGAIHCTGPCSYGSSCSEMVIRVGRVQCSSLEYYCSRECKVFVFGVVITKGGTRERKSLGTLRYTSTSTSTSPQHPHLIAKATHYFQQLEARLQFALLLDCDHILFVFFVVASQVASFLLTPPRQYRDKLAPRPRQTQRQPDLPHGTHKHTNYRCTHPNSCSGCEQSPWLSQRESSRRLSA